ncbi:MAG: VTT domain-containing protein [Desulfomonile sp.]|nr:VTT domain-containing protein [Desulfomonile sp.]
MLPRTRRDKIKLLVAVALLALQVSAIVWLAASERLGPLLASLSAIFQSKDQMRVYVEGWGSLAPLAFILLQTLQVVIAPIPGELTGAVGGFIFGAAPTVVYSSVGLTVGSALAFLAARIMGLPLVKLAVDEKTLGKFHFLTERRGAVLALILFIIPGFPKDILSYILGLSPMGFGTFIVVCGIGRIPGTVMLSFTGSAIFDENWTLLTVITVLCAVVLGFCFFNRSRIEEWLRLVGHRHD